MNSSEGTTPEAVAGLAAGLVELDALLAALSDTDYARRGAGVFSSSIGDHVRHCLDHVRALVEGVAAGRIDYDARTRGTPIEVDCGLARTEIARLLAELRTIAGQSFVLPVSVTVTFRDDAPPTWVESTLGRELGFVASHTVHHGALIAAIARTLGHAPPAEFGVAPATIAHLRRVAVEAGR